MRHLYPGMYVENTDGTAAKSTAFTVWDDQAAGSNVTAQLRGPDGTSGYPATTTDVGLALPFRGPDDDKNGPPLFLDTGIGVRFQLVSTTGMLKAIQDLKDLAAAVANLGAGNGTSTGPGSGLDAEAVRDVVAAMLVGGTYNDAADTYTLPTGAANALLYAMQSLNAAQQAQARANFGAVLFVEWTGPALPTLAQAAAAGWPDRTRIDWIPNGG